MISIQYTINVALQVELPFAYALPRAPVTTATTATTPTTDEI